MALVLQLSSSLDGLLVENKKGGELKIGLKMKLLKPSWVSHNGKLVQESGDQVGLLLLKGG